MVILVPTGSGGCCNCSNARTGVASRHKAIAVADINARILNSILLVSGLALEKNCDCGSASVSGRKSLFTGDGS
jgi:hypothetical protein